MGHVNEHCEPHDWSYINETLHQLIDDMDLEVDCKDQCSWNPCHNGAQCISEENGDFSCNCSERHHGRFCQFSKLQEPYILLHLP